MEEFSIERLTPDHYALLKNLFLDSFNSEISEADIHKRFDTKALGGPVIGFIAIHNETGRAAAYYGVFPLQLVSSGIILKAAQSGDTMTDPSHRKKGLFAKLAQLTFEICRQESIQVLYGFPNKNSYHGLVNTLKWQHVDDIARFDLKLKIKTFPLAKMCRHQPKAWRWYLKYAKSIIGKWIIEPPREFTNVYNPAYPRINRDNNYIAYKSSNDKFFINIAGQVVWVKLDDVLLIGDIGSYDKMTPKTLHKLRQLAFRLGYNTIRFYFNGSMTPPDFLNSFKRSVSGASCILKFDSSLSMNNYLFTAADFDTW